MVSTSPALPSALPYVLLLAVLLPHGTASSPASDPRNIATGATIGNMTSGYVDQPNCLVRRDGAWLCTATYNNMPEGSDGEHVITTISTDKGASWGPRYAVEPGQTLQHAYSTLFQGPGDVIYVVYVSSRVFRALLYLSV